MSVFYIIINTKTGGDTVVRSAGIMTENLSVYFVRTRFWGKTTERKSPFTWVKDIRPALEPDSILANLFLRLKM